MDDLIRVSNPYPPMRHQAIGAIGARKILNVVQRYETNAASAELKGPGVATSETRRSSATHDARSKPQNIDKAAASATNWSSCAREQASSGCALTGHAEPATTAITDEIGHGGGRRKVL
jgi:hypothetical protein